MDKFLSNKSEVKNRLICKTFDKQTCHCLLTRKPSVTFKVRKLYLFAKVITLLMKVTFIKRVIECKL